MLGWECRSSLTGLNPLVGEQGGWYAGPLGPQAFWHRPASRMGPSPKGTAVKRRRPAPLLADVRPGAPLLAGRAAGVKQQRPGGIPLGHLPAQPAGKAPGALETACRCLPALRQGALPALLTEHAQRSAALLVALLPTATDPATLLPVHLPATPPAAAEQLAAPRAATRRGDPARRQERCVRGRARKMGPRPLGPPAERRRHLPPRFADAFGGFLSCVNSLLRPSAQAASPRCCLPHSRAPPARLLACSAGPAVSDPALQGMAARRFPHWCALTTLVLSALAGMAACGRAVSRRGRLWRCLLGSLCRPMPAVSPLALRLDARAGCLSQEASSGSIRARN